MYYRDKFNNLVKNMKENKYDIDYDKLEEAFILASEAHLGQYRKSGEDYIIHPIEVAEILYELKMDSDTIIAGILHDVVEDTLITVSDLEYIFSKDIANLVDGVTKLRNLPKSQGKQSENIRKMVIAMTQDIRVVVIKLADRIHNMRTLNYQSTAKQIEKSKETMEIFAPIAHRIGMAKLKSELEDISFRYLEPEEYQKMKTLVSSKKIERENIISKAINKLNNELVKNNIKNFQITGRPKHLYSIYKKMRDKNKSFVELMDLMAIRVITEKESDCYAVLGIVHSFFTPIIERFKDYIAVPKANKYQSLHTTVICDGDITNGQPQNLEIQIRTYEMHDIAENGVAAHWKYKEKKQTDKNEAYFSAKKQELSSHITEKKDNNFAQIVTENILKETIFVLTPKDEVREISANATVLDFAFLIHTQIGYKTIGAKINDKIVPLNTVLKNGDKIEILTSSKTNGPGKDWINMVNINANKAKIRKWFNDLEFSEKSQLGMALIEKEFEKIGIRFKDVQDDGKILLYMKKYNLTTLEQLAFKFQEGTLSIQNLIKKFEKEDEINIDEILEKNIDKNNHKRKDNNSILIDGTDNTSIILSKCCHPFPGDDIKAYAKTGKGFMIHKSTCPNLISVLKNNPEKEIMVDWNENVIKNNNQRYSFSFKVKIIDKPGSLLEIVKIINDQKIDLESVNSSSKSQNGIKYVIIDIIVGLKNKDEFKRIEKLIRNINSVIDIYTN